MDVLVYTGDPGDPMFQNIRLVSVETFEAAEAEFPSAVFLQVYDPCDEMNVGALKRGTPVWSF